MNGINLLLNKFMKASNSDSYIEAICDFSKEHEIEIEEIVDNLDPILKKQVEIEFIRKNYFPNRKLEGSMDEFFSDI